MAGSRSVWRALVVERDPMLATFYIRALGNFGFHAEVLTGPDLLGVLAGGGPYDLLVLNPLSEESADPALVRAVRAAGYNIPILGITGDSGPGEIEFGPTLGLVVGLAKPFTLLELRAALHRLGFSGSGGGTDR